MTTSDELHVMNLLGEALNCYARLPKQHPSELDDFTDAIHRLQDLIAIRVARRADPENWPCKDSAGKILPIDSPGGAA